MAILCDLTEFFTHPHRTGIQRVSYEIVSRRDGKYSLIPVCLNKSGDFAKLPSHSFDLMTEFFEAKSDEKLLRAKASLTKLVKSPETRLITDFSRYTALFTPEVFFCKQRIESYEKIASRGDIELFLIVYDYLPWTCPQYYPGYIALNWYPFLKLQRLIPHLSFISDASWRIAEEQVFRGKRSAGVAIPLGSDGLGSKSPNFEPEKTMFSVIGTIEPRKGHLKILDAFESLWQQGLKVPLTFVGREGWLCGGGMERIRHLNREQPLFNWHSDLADAGVRRVIEQSRATIYISENEGFGLPPVESLALERVLKFSVSILLVV